VPHSRTTTPSWHRPTLQKKRVAHQACFADLLGIPLAHFPPGKFEVLADACYEEHWLAYEADCRDKETREFVGLRRYFVDHMLGLAVTTHDESRFVTYFHEDLDLPHGKRPEPNASVGQRKLEYLSQLDRDQKTTKLRSVKILTER